MGTRGRENVKAEAAARKAGASAGGSRRAQSGKKIALSMPQWMLIIAVAQAFMDAGGAMRIGLTKDGGALALGCYLGDDYGTEYIRPQEDLETALAEIASEWLPLGADGIEAAITMLEANTKNGT